jgi:hypothetical protein
VSDPPDRGRIAIGVAGHRALADVECVANGVRLALDRITAAHPERPMDMVSSLAEGADRLVARLALERSGARLIVPLPLEPDDFMRDFATPASREEFSALLARAEGVVRMPPAASREDAYRLAGEYVADHAEILIAVWDGRSAQGGAGTAHVVERARRLGRPVAWVHAGNRRPGTMEPTSLGAAQGTVTFDGFPTGLASGMTRTDTSAAHGPPAAMPYRIRIGVLGDGATVPTDALTQAVRAILETHVQSLFDDASRALLRRTGVTVAHAAITTLSSASERAVARAILEQPDARLEPVMDADPSAFAARVADPVVRRELEAMLALARLPIVVGEGRRRAEAAGTSERERLSRHIIDHCDLLIISLAADAAADSDPTIRRARAAGRPIFVVPAEAPAKFTCERGHGLNARSALRMQIYDRRVADTAATRDYARNVGEKLFASATGAKIPRGTQDEIRAMLVPHYVAASALAKESQTRYRRAGRAVWVLFPVAVAAAAVAALLPAGRFPAVLVEAATLVTIGLLVWDAHRARCHERWVESRFLAERLRAGMFLAACGVEVSSIRVPPYMGDPEQRDEWMVMAFDEIWKRLPGRTGCAPDRLAEVVAFARVDWIGDQIRFHRDKAERCERASRLLERGGTAMFGLALIAALAHLAMRGAPGHGAAYSALENALGMLAIVLPAIGAAMGGFRAHREYSRLAKRSLNMAQELDRLGAELADAGSPEAVEALLHTAEEFTVGETQDWLMLMRHAPITRPG